ncbi:hypothetical protein AUEXF2481DRAFT_32697 [Aureobasidium subglaciale EXF-2481]|uniref:t-SNARE coiled-coil homology domain-containing protein n=1 Tax=Aureobasidium subglaciale (strain EXF-2481) TaxID=1043005 RepID=A0A074Y2K6_AURSE|nr:uncharacterized protein AUEXF2481DRAFT_32697 [Aureobasidium subglaciale EXF-2481]KAI5204043.1 hypothetical protein E4T38_04916 [Aureobasidium subglaciale]KAI5222857.1 hypothetical protein E4T40_04830 [Aureobasidium subglaciale]KAI5226603.1 hypothetical protein E4T41_04773 [Aureobasidium subglaciale]KAI5263042.1 hypothetical protein E4T46_04018 [Aureobasidium subglaciale]KEQ91965.1 hypothetical protein AUEXF2481DRAFT_32697 [Aureobasidium subglaciale EXF-2481]
MATTTENISVDLDQLLTRLSNTLLSPTADDTHLRTTPYERNRISANVEYARTLLLRLEHTSSDLKIATQKTALQSSLQQKRDRIKQLNTRLIELNQLASSQDDSSSSEDEDDEDDETRAREFAPAVRTSDTLDTDPSLTSPQQAAQDLATTLRKRNTNALDSNAPPDTATTSALFGARTPTNLSNTGDKLSTEQILDSATRDQDTLTSSLVALAQRLKQSSLSFASSLESEKEVLRRAETGLDRNSMGMEAAGNRMGMLRRMTEGKGWWGRIRLYAIIAGLWIIAFLFVFAGPKLRF